MEHRYTERHTSDLKILIHKHGLPTAIGRIRNGGRMGVYVETDFADIECEHQLTLEVMPNRQQAKQGMSIRAMVIHKTQGGFGAELDIDTDEQAELFIELLRSPKFQARPQAQEFAVAVNG